jgi:hypothetical protein
MKIQRHIAFLKGRSLTIKGSSLVANAILLSRLWHILRVVPVPSAWLDSVRKMIKAYVLPFARAPSWDTICLRKKHGGLSLIDIRSQHLALQLIYLQRLFKYDGTQYNDFATPFMISLLQLHSGLSSVLPLVMFPDLYAANTLSLISCKLPMLHQLLLGWKRLPSLTLDGSWHCQWFLDLPLRRTLLSTASARNTNYTMPDIPVRYLVSDLLQLSPQSNGKLCYKRDLKYILRKLRKDIQDQHLQWLGPIQNALLRNVHSTTSKAGLPAAWGEDAINLGYRTRWLPNTFSWVITTSGSKPVLIFDVPLQTVRHYWHPINKSKHSHPPLIHKLPQQYLRPVHWRLLWSLPLPARVFHHWWRLIHQAISIRPVLHTWYPKDHPSALCLLCGQATETYYHFAVGCPLKQSLWSLALSTLSLDKIFPNADEIWNALTFHAPSISDDLGCLPTAFTSDHLVIIGTIFSAIWCTHYACLMNQDGLWIPSNAEAHVSKCPSWVSH